MATISAFHSLSSICRVNSRTMPNHSSSMSRPIRNLHLQSRGVVANFSKHRTVSESRGVRKIRSVAEETLIPAEEEDSNNPEASPDQPVSVPVSPSDMLTMIFQAEGTMNETAIPTVTKALEEKEGISNLKVKVLEGIASVELTKQTTVQATGVASSLVETIQGSGFKLQTLNLSFEDEEDIIN